MGYDSHLPLKKSGQSVIDRNLPYRFLRGQPLNIYKKTSRVEILCINIKLYNLTSGRTNHHKVYQNQLKRLKRAEKLIFLKLEPIFSEASQMEWHEPFDFQTGISGFPCQWKEPLDLSSLVLTHGTHACNSICPINIPKHITGTLCVYC